MVKVIFQGLFYYSIQNQERALRMRLRPSRMLRNRKMVAQLKPWLADLLVERPELPLLCRDEGPLRFFFRLLTDSYFVLSGTMGVKECQWTSSCRKEVILDCGEGRSSSSSPSARILCSSISMFLVVSWLLRKLREVRSCPHSTWLLLRKSSVSDRLLMKEGSLRKEILFFSLGQIMLYSRSSEALLAARCSLLGGGWSNLRLISSLAAASSHALTSWFFCCSSWMKMYSRVISEQFIFISKRACSSVPLGWYQMQMERLSRPSLRQVLSLSMTMFLRLSSLLNSAWNRPSSIWSSLSPVVWWCMMETPFLRLLQVAWRTWKALVRKEVKLRAPWLVSTTTMADSRCLSSLNALMSHLGMRMSEQPKMVLELNFELKLRQFSYIFSFPCTRISPSFRAQWNQSITLGPSSSSSARISPQQPAFTRLLSFLGKKPVRVIIFWMRLALRWSLNFLRCGFSTKLKLSWRLRKKGFISISQYFFSKRSLLMGRLLLPSSSTPSSMQQCAISSSCSSTTRSWYLTLYSLCDEQNFSSCLWYSALDSTDSPFLRSASAMGLVVSTKLSKLSPRYFLSSPSTLSLPKTLPRRRMMERKKEISLMMRSTSRRDSAESISDMTRRSAMNCLQSFSERTSSMLNPAASTSSCSTFTRSSKSSSTQELRSKSLMISLRICTMDLVRSVLRVTGASRMVESAYSLSYSMMGWLQTCLEPLPPLRMLRSSFLQSARMASSISQYSLMVILISDMLILYQSLLRMMASRRPLSLSSFADSFSKRSVLAFREQYLRTSFSQSLKYSHFSLNERSFLLNTSTISRQSLLRPLQVSSFSLRISNLLRATLCDLVPSVTLLLLSWLLMVRCSRLTFLTKLRMTRPCVEVSLPVTILRSQSSVAWIMRLQRRWQMACMLVTSVLRYSMQLKSLLLFSSILRQQFFCSMRIYGILSQFIIHRLLYKQPAGQ